MSKKMNHTAEPSKLTRFRSFEEMKATPVSFPFSEPLAQQKAEYKEVIAKLRSNYSANRLRLRKANKTILK
jgi:hypothetical protein